jgi:hypothetical protein
MQITPTFFKSLTNFIITKVDNLVFLVVFIINTHAKSIGETFIYRLDFRVSIKINVNIMFKGSYIGLGCGSSVGL